MLRELEQRLADVLGASLPAPLAGAVDVLPGDSVSQAVVSVHHAEPAREDFLSSRAERVPGVDASRRIVRLKCDVTIDVRQRAGQNHQDMAGKRPDRPREVRMRRFLVALLSATSALGLVGALVAAASTFTVAPPILDSF